MRRADDPGKTPEQVDGHSGRRAARASEALDEPARLEWMRLVRDLTGRAGLLRREHLAGVAASGGIEHRLDRRHRREVSLGEDPRHEVTLLETDAVFAGNRAPHLHARAHDLGPRRQHPLFLPRLPGIVEDVRMEVAVTRVEDVADAKGVRVGDSLDAPQ